MSWRPPRSTSSARRKKLRATEPMTKGFRSTGARFAVMARRNAFNACAWWRRLQSANPIATRGFDHPGRCAAAVSHRAVARLTAPSAIHTLPTK